MGANAAIVEFMDILRLGWDVTIGAANGLAGKTGGHASVRIEIETRKIRSICGREPNAASQRHRRNNIMLKTSQIIAKQAPYVN